jgi:hypothetical protein
MPGFAGGMGGAMPGAGGAPCQHLVTLRSLRFFKRVQLPLNSSSASFMMQFPCYLHNILCVGYWIPFL